jgi:hypothetical protein
MGASWVLTYNIDFASGSAFWHVIAENIK